MLFTSYSRFWLLSGLLLAGICLTEFMNENYTCLNEANDEMKNIKQTSWCRIGCVCMCAAGAFFSLLMFSVCLNILFFFCVDENMWKWRKRRQRRRRRRPIWLVNWWLRTGNTWLWNTKKLLTEKERKNNSSPISSASCLQAFMHSDCLNVCAAPFTFLYTHLRHIFHCCNFKWISNMLTKFWEYWER